MTIKIRDRAWTLRAPVSALKTAACVQAPPRLVASWSRDGGDGRLRRAWRMADTACEPPSRRQALQAPLRRAA